MGAAGLPHRRAPGSEADEEVRSSQRYRSRKDPQLALRGKLKELASTHVHYGYRGLTVLLRRQGWKVNVKRWSMDFIGDKLADWRGFRIPGP